MASLEKRGRSFRVVFRLQGVKYSRSLGVTNARTAQMALLRLQDDLERLERGAIAPPPDIDLLDFLFPRDRSQLESSDRMGSGPLSPSSAEQLTLAALFAEYFSKLPSGSLELCTISAMKRHQRQLEQRFGRGFLINGLTSSKLQSYVENRARDDGRNGRKVSPVTIKKAIITLRTVWNWGRHHELVTKPYPSRGLKYPKGTEKPPFKTFSEIARRAPKLSPAEANDLWECAFLSLAEIEELLATVKVRARHPFIYPLFVFAAHTGARRSEIVRSVLSDLDFEANLITIHERKKSHENRTSRQVPMSALLRESLQAWLARRPQSDHTFCHNETAGFTHKRRNAPLPLTVFEAHDHLRRTLRGTKWEKLHGWHVFRHSFCSNCAAKGIDQRVIDAWVGHLSEDMVRRYRHLLPDQHQSAIAAVFGALPELPDASERNGK